jgi:hypothetical protein
MELEELLLGTADDQHPPVKLEVVQHRRLLGHGSRVLAAYTAFAASGRSKLSRRST